MDNEYDLLCMKTPQRKCFRAVCQSHFSSTHGKKQAKHGLKGGKETAFTWNYPSSFLLKLPNWHKFAKKMQTLAIIINNKIRTSIEGNEWHGVVDPCKRQLIFFSSFSTFTCTAHIQNTHLTLEQDKMLIVCQLTLMVIWCDNCGHLFFFFKAKPKCLLQCTLRGFFEEPEDTKKKKAL